MMRGVRPRPLARMVRVTLGSTAWSSSIARQASTRLPLVPPRAGGMNPLISPRVVACSRIGRVDWNLSGPLGKAAYLARASFSTAAANAWVF